MRIFSLICLLVIVAVNCDNGQALRRIKRATPAPGANTTQISQDFVKLDEGSRKPIADSTNNAEQQSADENEHLITFKDKPDASKEDKMAKDGHTNQTTDQKDHESIEEQNIVRKNDADNDHVSNGQNQTDVDLKSPKPLPVLEVIDAKPTKDNLMFLLGDNDRHKLNYHLYDEIERQEDFGHSSDVVGGADMLATIDSVPLTVDDEKRATNTQTAKFHPKRIRNKPRTSKKLALHFAAAAKNNNNNIKNNTVNGGNNAGTCAIKLNATKTANNEHNNVYKCSICSKASQHGTDKNNQPQPHECGLGQQAAQSTQRICGNFTPIESILKFANMLLYKMGGFDGNGPVRAEGTSTSIKTLPLSFNGPDTDDLDTMDYFYNPAEGAPPTVARTASMSYAPSFLMQQQYGQSDSAPPFSIFENALGSLLGGDDVDGEDDMDLLCPIHQANNKVAVDNANGNTGDGGENKNDLIQVCSCRFYKKKKN